MKMLALEAKGQKLTPLQHHLLKHRSASIIFQLMEFTVPTNASEEYINVSRVSKTDVSKTNGSLLTLILKLNDTEAPVVGD